MHGQQNLSWVEVPECSRNAIVTEVYVSLQEGDEPDGSLVAEFVPVFYDVELFVEGLDFMVIFLSCVYQGSRLFFASVTFTDLVWAVIAAAKRWGGA